MQYGLCHDMLVSGNRQGLDLLKIRAKVLRKVSSNRTFEFSKLEIIMNSAILTFKIQQKCLNTKFMFSHSWLHQSEYLGRV